MPDCARFLEIVDEHRPRRPPGRPRTCGPDHHERLPDTASSRLGDVRVMSVAALRNAVPPRHFADRVDVTEADIAQPGDVLVAIEGGTVGETLVVPEGLEDFVPSQQAVTLRVGDRTSIDPWYLGAWLTSESWR